jgi:hypothetical protein
MGLELISLIEFTGMGSERETFTGERLRFLPRRIEKKLKKL